MFYLPSKEECHELDSHGELYLRDVDEYDVEILHTHVVSVGSICGSSPLFDVLKCIVGMDKSLNTYFVRCLTVYEETAYPSEKLLYYMLNKAFDLFERRAKLERASTIEIETSLPHCTEHFVEHKYVFGKKIPAEVCKVYRGRKIV